MKRDFFPWDKWQYYKIYIHHKSCDTLLSETIFPMTQKMLKDKLISRWFFIRYYDTDFHLRVRFEIDSVQHISTLSNIINQYLSPLCKRGLISNISISTYRREIERYGKKYICASETIFCMDSICICKILTKLKNDETSKFIIAFKLVDLYLFLAFGTSVSKKIAQMESLTNAYRHEFGYNTYNSKQLNKLYRKHVQLIIEILEQSTPSSSNYYYNKLLCEYSNKIKTVYHRNMNIESYIHMSINRLFSFNNRLYELLIYDFLYRYYTSLKYRVSNNKQLISTNYEKNF